MREWVYHALSPPTTFERKNKNKLNKKTLIKSIMDLKEAKESIFKGLEIPEKLMKFAVETAKNKAMNSEGLQLGDKITLTGFPDDTNSGTIDKQAREWITVNCEGARSSISLGNLVSTDKLSHFLDDEKRELKVQASETSTTLVPALEVADNFDKSKRLVLKRNMAEALADVARNCIGKTFEVTAISRKCGINGQTFYFWQKVD